MRISGRQQQSKPVWVLFTGGGTGGHVYPGIAVFEAMMKKAASRSETIQGFWVGSGRAMERCVIEAQGIQYVGIPSGKLRRYFSWSNLIDVFKVVAGIVCAYFVIRRYRPRVLFSKGGYVSVPPVIAAKLAGVPVITHESDFDPGLATRINARFAMKVVVSYEQTCEYFPESLKPRLVIAGNPVRREVLSGNAERGRTFLAFDSDRPILLVLGGSQGAREVNELVWRVLPSLLEQWNVVHQTGSDESGPSNEKRYRRYDYIHGEYGDILSAADLVLCRAGATTLWELAAAGKPSILVPLGAGSSRGDQIRNAALFESLGASYILHPKPGEESELLKYTGVFLSESGIPAQMGKNARSVFKPDAADRIADLVLEFVFGEVSHAG